MIRQNISVFIGEAMLRAFPTPPCSEAIVGNKHSRFFSVAWMIKVSIRQQLVKHIEPDANAGSQTFNRGRRNYPFANPGVNCITAQTEAMSYLFHCRVC